MSTQQRAGRVRSTYAFIKAHRERYSVQSMCRILGVAPSGYSEWILQPISNRLPRRRPPAPVDPGVVHRESGHLRCPSCVLGLA